MRFKAAVAGLLMLGVLGTAVPAASAADCTAEKLGKRPTPRSALEVKAPKRKSIKVSTGDRNRTTLSLKGRGALGNSPTDASAEVVEDPVTEDFEALDADVFPSASPVAVGRQVRLEVCADSGGTLDAGTYRGKLVVYGPQLKPFRYTLVLTQRWAFWTAALILAGAGVLYVALMWNTPLPPGNKVTPKTNWIYAPIILLGFAAAYFTVYLKNPTWGDNGLTDVIGLVTAGITAAGVATAFASKLAGPAGGRGGGRNDGGDVKEEE